MFFLLILIYYLILLVNFPHKLLDVIFFFFSPLLRNEPQAYVHPYSNCEYQVEWV